MKKALIKTPRFKDTGWIDKVKYKILTRKLRKANKRGNAEVVIIGSKNFWYY